MTPSNFTILAFDTTGTQDSLSLYHQGSLVSKILPQGGSQLQSSLLVPSLKQLLEEHHLTFKDVHVISTLSGPGSFTGIRIGLATLQGLLLAHPFQPIVPNLLEVLAFAVSQQQIHSSILSVIDTKREDYFAQFFHPNLLPQDEPFILQLQELPSFSPLALLASNTSLPKGVEAWSPSQPISELLITFCLKLLRENNTQKYENVEPFYIRNPEFKKQARFWEIGSNGTPHP